MKILIVGGSGTIGKAVAKELEKRHEVIVAGKTHGDIKVDITDIKSIEQMYKSVGTIDAIVSTAGKVYFGAFLSMTPEHYALGLNDKLMGQVNLVLAGLPFLNDMGSFTLTSGILSQDPIRFGSSGSMVNGAVDGFVKSVALEMSRGIRINAVSPTIVTESLSAYGEYFLGFDPVPVARVALAYSKSVEGAQTGCVYRVGY